MAIVEPPEERHCPFDREIRFREYSSSDHPELAAHLLEAGGSLADALKRVGWN